MRCDKGYDSMKPSKLHWIFLGVIISVIYATTYYEDNVGIMASAATLCESVWKNGPAGLIMGANLPYGLFLQWICAIWALPAFIIHTATGLEYDTMPMQFYFKILELLFLFLAFRALVRIISEVRKDESKNEWAGYYFLSSLMVILPVVYIAQVDIIYIWLMLEGICYYLRDDRKKFLLCFFLAIPMKYFPVVFFIPLVLLHEKKIMNIVKELFIGCSGVILDKLLSVFRQNSEQAQQFRQTIVNSTAGIAADGTAEVTSGTVTSVILNRANVFCVIFVLICIWAVLQNEEKDSRQFKANMVWMTLAAAFDIFLLLPITPYWIVMLSPFLIIGIFSFEKFGWIDYAFEFIITICYIYIYTIDMPWVFGSCHIFDKMPLSLVPVLAQRKTNMRISGPAEINIVEIMTPHGLTSFTGIAAAIIVGCAAALLMLNYPYAKIRENLLKKDMTPKQLRITADLRVAMLYIWYAVIFMAAYRILI